MVGDISDRRSRTASVSADLYVLVGSDENVWPRINVKWNETGRRILRRSPEIIATPQPTPLDEWVYESIDLTDEGFHTHFKPAELSGSNFVHLTDTIGWNPLRIVSSRLRSLLESLDIDGGRFFDFSYLDSETKEDVRAGYFFWLPRRYLRYKPKEKKQFAKPILPSVWGVLGKPDVTWEMKNNRLFRNFVSELPYWTAGPGFDQIVFRPDVFEKISALNLSGFNEAPAQNYLSREPHHTIGYIFYNDS